MGPIMAAALGSGIVSGIWTYFGGVLGSKYPELFATWIGFVGITSYFAAGCGKEGFTRSLVSNLVGVLIGCTIIALSIGRSNGAGAIITGIFTWLICYLVRIDITKFAFCTFMGGFSAFATGGNYKMLIICLIIGNIVGHLCFVTGNLLYEKFGNQNAQENIIKLTSFED